MFLIKKLFNLRADMDREGTVELIKSNVDFHSANAWTLVFAIFIASVGLNINSTAVIIGAMLISPLMGPIVGTGLALGIHDYALLKRSLRGLLAAVIISIVASTIYFLISPLSEVQSELLARTRPSFYDVLVAFFGGAAGIVAISRKEKGNAIPGVAIATALMPPLCTAGFGLATRNFSYFAGAIYLFIINCVFISISTFIFVRYLGFHHAVQASVAQNKVVDRWIAYVGGIVLIPSFFMAWYLQQESYFKSQANKYIDQELRSQQMYIIEREISYDIESPKIRVAVIGNVLDKEGIDLLKQKAILYSLKPDSVDIRQTSYSDHFEKKLNAQMSNAEETTRALQLKLTETAGELNALKDQVALSRQLSDETSVLFPHISRILIVGVKSEKTEDQPQVLVRWKKTPPGSDVSKINQFLIKRLGVEARSVSNVLEL